MRSRFIALAALAALFCSPAFGAPVWAPSQGGTVGSNVACTNGNGDAIRCIQPSVTLNDATGAALGTSGNPLVTSGSSSGSNQVVGNVASGAADSGNPVKVGGVYNSTPPTLTTGQRGDTQLTARGFGITAIGDATGNGVAQVTTGQDGANNANPGLISYSRTSAFNGSTWDRAVTCASSAAVNVTAGSTTQIVGLSGTTVIRVCSITLSMSAAGSMGVYTGTGANCGTGTTALIQDMTLATGTPVAQTASAGGSLVRSSAGGEICVKAVTGNVTGSISYAQF